MAVSGAGISSTVGVQGSADMSASLAALQRALKEQRDRNELLLDELRDERTHGGKLRAKLARREAEMRAEAAAASAAAQERVRFARASRVLASHEGRAAAVARSSTLGSQVCHAPGCAALSTRQPCDASQALWHVYMRVQLIVSAFAARVDGRLQLAQDRACACRSVQRRVTAQEQLWKRPVARTS